MAYHYYFPREWVELQIELSYHPDCIEAVMKATDHVAVNPFTRELQFNDEQTTFLTKVLAIATYCEVLVDGEYTAAEINKLCEILTDKLRERRKEWRVDSHE